MDSIRKIGPGLLLCLAIALPSWLLGHFFPVVGGPVFAILIGMLLALVLRDKSPYQSGIAFTSKKILQYAVILLGFGLNLSEIAKVGAQSLPIICSTISISLIIAFLIRKGLHMPNNISVLVGVGSSICGGSAIAATAPVIGADDEEIAQSISVIFLFNILAALLFPTLGALLGMTNEGFGLFAGTAINDTSSVTAAASTMAGADPHLFQPFKELSKFFIILAMAAIGLNTDLVKLVKTGGKPIFMGTCCWVGITAVSLLMQHMQGLF